MTLGRLLLAWLPVAAWFGVAGWGAHRLVGLAASPAPTPATLLAVAVEALLVTLFASLWFDSLGHGEWWLLFGLVGILATGLSRAPGVRRRGLLRAALRRRGSVARLATGLKMTAELFPDRGLLASGDRAACPSPRRPPPFRTPTVLIHPPPSWRPHDDFPGTGDRPPGDLLWWAGHAPRRHRAAPVGHPQTRGRPARRAALYRARRPHQDGRLHRRVARHHRLGRLGDDGSRFRCAAGQSVASRVLGADVPRGTAARSGADARWRCPTARC